MSTIIQIIKWTSCIKGYGEETKEYEEHKDLLDSQYTSSEGNSFPVH